jgi:Zn finger protein HypA/HybF involved in hydrogenase expression
MAAYKLQITKYKCHCGKNATHQVFNTYNASYGFYCTKCADKQVKVLNSYDKISTT